MFPTILNHVIEGDNVISCLVSYEKIPPVSSFVNVWHIVTLRDKKNCHSVIGHKFCLFVPPF